MVTILLHLAALAVRAFLLNTTAERRGTLRPILGNGWMDTPLGQGGDPPASQRPWHPRPRLWRQTVRWVSTSSTV